MTHARQQIRARIADTTLASMASSTGSGVIYKSRSRTITQYPSIAVFVSSERVETENPGFLNSDTKRYRRIITLTVEIAVQTNTTPDEALDALCVTAEELIAGDDTMGGAVHYTDLKTVRMLLDGNGEEEIHTCNMTYDVEYRTAADDVETILA